MYLLSWFSPNLQRNCAVVHSPEFVSFHQFLILWSSPILVNVCLQGFPNFSFRQSWVFPNLPYKSSDSNGNLLNSFGPHVRADSWRILPIFLYCFYELLSLIIFPVFTFPFLKYFEYSGIFDVLVSVEKSPNTFYMTLYLSNWLWAHKFTNLLVIMTESSDCIYKFLFLIGCPVNRTWLICTFIFNMEGKSIYNGLITSSFYMLGNFLIVFPVLIQCPLKSLNFIRLPVTWILLWHRLFLVFLSWLNLPGQFDTSLSLFWLFKD